LIGFLEQTMADIAPVFAVSEGVSIEVPAPEFATTIDGAQNLVGVGAGIVMQYFQSYVMCIGFDFVELGQIVHVVFVGLLTSLDVIVQSSSTVFYFLTMTVLTLVYELVLHNLA
jgi:hypothetical protein